ncbi:MAG: GGDEF domain-containing protein [Oscillospiraceae bacterium]
MVEKTRKCIGVIVGKPTRRHQAELLKGIYSAAFANDMNVAVFGTSIARIDKETRLGEENIYSLINYEKLSGVLYLKDTIHFDDIESTITEPLLKAHREFGIPAVTIDAQVEGLPAFFSDDSDNVRMMTEHIIQKHRCKDIAYLTGPKGHPHAERRLAVFRQVMRENGLAVDESRVFYGDFWYGSGAAFTEQLLASEKGLPEAVICANAPMAESMYKALLERDIHAPADILLAGYDDTLEYASFISSAIRCSESVGKAACEGLIALINGESLPERQEVSCGVKTNYSISCGCTFAHDINLLYAAGAKPDDVNDYFSEYNSIDSALIGSSDYNAMLWSIDWFTYFLKDFTDLHFCMCSGWDEPASSVDESVVQTRYTPQMEICYRHTNNPDGTVDRQIGSGELFDTKDMFPLLYSADGDPAAYLFRPLHFNERCFGYAVISFGNRLRVPEEIFDFWINDVSDALESQRRLNNMRWLYGEMQKNAVTDMMTGLMNRNGFNMMLPQIIAEAGEQNALVLLIMADLNNLKYINDTFGHPAGDEAIKTAAGALSRTWMGGATSEKNFRIGGDEFVKLAVGHFTEAQTAEFKRALSEYLNNYNATAGKPYPIYMSLGFASSPADSAEIESLLNEADEKMYRDKVRLKKETGFDHKRE